MEADITFGTGVRLGVGTGVRVVDGTGVRLGAGTGVRAVDGTGVRLGAGTGVRAGDGTIFDSGVVSSRKDTVGGIETGLPLVISM